MTHRSVGGLLLLSVVTFGIYALYWLVVTKGEMNTKGAEIPTAWFLLIPLVNIWWMWKFSEGVEAVTQQKLSAPLAFVLLWLLGLIGMAIIQSSLNPFARK